MVSEEFNGGLNDICVSIVIPAYNHRRYLSDAINSVLEQDYPNIELIVLNDGSTDSTAELLEEYDDKFYWETQENIGQANTLNKGWALSKGQILSYLSADDVLKPNAVSESLKVLNLSEAIVMTYCDFNLIDERSNLIKVSTRAEFDYKSMLVNLNCIPGPGVFFRKNAYLDVGPWNSEYKQMPDYDFWLRLGLVGKFKRVPIVLANFRVHDESLTFSKPSIERATEPVNLITSFFLNKKIPNELKELKQHSLSNAHSFSALLHLKAGRYICAIQSLSSSLRLYPRNVLHCRTYKMLINGLLGRPFYIFIRLLRSIAIYNR